MRYSSLCFSLWTKDSECAIGHSKDQLLIGMYLEKEINIVTCM